MAIIYCSFELLQPSSSSCGTEPCILLSVPRQLKSMMIIHLSRGRCMCLRSGCPQIKFICSNHEEMIIKIYELKHKECCDPLKKHLQQSDESVEKFLSSLKKLKVPDFVAHQQASFLKETKSSL
jgi:hypothetical protein